MTSLLLIGLFVINPAWALSAKKVQGKKDAWLVKKIERIDDREDLILIIDEMAVRRTVQFLPILITYSQHPLDDIRRASLEALIAYGPALDDDRRDQAYLDRLMDSNQGVSKLARKGILQRIQSEVNTTYLSNALLHRCKNSTAWKEQLYILEILQWITDPKIDQLLVDMASHNSNPEVRRLSVSALGERRMTETRSLLQTIHNRDLDPEVRKAAKKSLHQIGGKISDAVIAVMPFEIQNDELKEVAIGFQNYLSGALSSAQIATFVERGQVDKVMEELIYQDTNIDDNKAIEIGKSLRASQVITGNLQSHGNNVTITIKLIDVRNQEILHSAQSSGLLIDFDALQRDVATKFLESM